MPGSISVRLEKLRFLIAEMQVALVLAEHAPDDFVARIVARHIAVRTENFIEHARRLRTVLSAGKYKVRDFHRKKEVYARFFEEYFKIARHKLSAHVQDMDFGKRIELWTEFETSKLAFFVDGAKELYDSLGTLGIPDFVGYVEPTELKDPALLAVLQSISTSADSRPRAEVGTDPLAMTRRNTVAVGTGGAVQQRASQLVMIRRWIREQFEFLSAVNRFAISSRVLRERIVTDIVSFCDCLVTRNVLPNAAQELTGLDSLLVAEAQDASAISQFVQISDFQARLAAARAVRDRVGAHFEIDETVTLSDLLNEIDGFAFDECRAFYKAVAQIFTKVCFATHFLRMHAVDGQRLQGVTPNAFPGGSV